MANLFLTSPATAQHHHSSPNHNHSHLHTKPTSCNPRKRSPGIAFSHDATPPSSRPPSRTHTKRLQLRRALSDRPSWVTPPETSRQIATRIPAGACFNVQQATIPNGPAYHYQHQQQQQQDQQYLRQVPVSELLRPGCAFTVLVFLGGTRAVLDSLAAVRGLLQGLGAGVLGVSLQDVQGLEIPVPVVWDRERTLARGLGMLHPLGGGRVALDAVVVLDAEWRERVVLPVGWGVRGAGRDAESVEANVVGRVVRAVEWLKEEWEEGLRRETAMEVDMMGDARA